jgi:fatty-acyl-CoA synthase
MEKMSNMTLPALLDRLEQACGEKVFLYTEEGEVTYRELAQRSRWSARALAQRGVVAGDRVALATENRPEWLIAFFGLLRLGAIAVTINPLYRESELLHMLRSTDTKVVISESKSGDYDLAQFYAGAELPELTHRIFLPGSPLPMQAGSESFEQWLASGRDTGPMPAPAPPSADEPAVILFSSGTTGRSKGAVLTHRSIIASGAAQAECFRQCPDDVILGAMPLNHVGGLTCTITSALVAGCSVELIRRFNPVAVFERLKRGRITFAFGVPTMYSMMLAIPDLQGMDLSRVRLCVIGGSNVEPALAKAVMKLFPQARLANLYGLSESSGACIISPEGEDLEHLLTTIGVAIGDFQTRTVNSSGTPLADGEIGELQVKGECVMKEYWRMPEQTAQVIDDEGWLSTGDIAVRSSDGHVALRGRSKEMFIRGGYNVYPSEVENTIAQLPQVAMVAVVGVPDEKYGATGCAFVVRKDGHTADAEQILRHCRSQLADYKVPDVIEFVDALPLTPSGKIKKSELRPASMRA